MKSNEFLQAAIDVQKERGAQYDKPSGERSMGATVAAFNCITGNNLKEQDGWMLLGLLKLVRQSQNPEKYHHDSALDFVAYASLYAEAASEQCKPVEEVRKTGGKIPDGVTYIVGEDASEQCQPVEEVTESKIPEWSYRLNAPETANFLAMDKDGKWHWFDDEPYIHGSYTWFTSKTGKGGFLKADDLFRHTDDWTKSLFRRPQQ